ncbi:ATP-binding protein [Propioniciclava coleopterorum]|uniref:ATP-binding protein n=1 Tax=Propioniciclava coleopterorum TaxID=2714937 RepID=A0A6G7Y361_9ACTN|nr:AAA family ATPase [Propioniciclava coleopterorum]QIK71047.1 ATP-binding protein [Propioniciclava coleopterorum]
MVRIQVSGMSGTGKSTLLAALSARGVATVETDVDGWEVAPGVWDEPRMTRLLADSDEVVVAGQAQNQGRFADRFDHIVHLHAPLPVLLARVAARTTNPYGGTPAQRAEIAEHVETVEPLLRAAATVLLDATRPRGEIVAEVWALLRPDRTG